MQRIAVYVHARFGGPRADIQRRYSGPGVSDYWVSPSKDMKGNTDSSELWHSPSVNLLYHEIHPDGLSCEPLLVVEIKADPV